MDQSLCESLTPPPKRKKEAREEEDEEKLLLQSLPFVVEFKTFIPDIAEGKEKYPIPCVNWIDDVLLPRFTYVPRCTFDASVSMATDSGFMIRCDCSNKCADSANCACRNLTSDEGCGLLRNKEDVMSRQGYTNNKLMNKLISGVYECNRYCGCGSGCGNRLVQNGIQHKLMVYKTEKIGWGVMSLEDIPKGSFVCCYTGLVVSDDEADNRGLCLGDDYLAELDYIEVLELAKSGFDDDVDNSNSDDSPAAGGHSVSPLLTVSPSPLVTSGSSSTDISTPSTPHDNISRNDDGQFFLVSASPDNSNRLTSSLSSTLSLPPTRSLFNETHSYVIDANHYSNVARFINHSCSPNLFVQNIFVESHDIRFPSVAFFAESFIPAYTQLCWDYNYIVGSVSGKKIICQCQSDKCRGRLL